MEVKSSLNNLRTAPRKVRLVADLVRNKNIQNAKSLLEVTPNKSSDVILKLLNSALASAVNNFKLEESDLYISKITVDEGPKLKRWHPMSRGRAYPILKRTSNITLILNQRNGSSVKKLKEKTELNKEIKEEKKELKTKKSSVKKIVKKEKPKSK